MEKKRAICRRICFLALLLFFTAVPVAAIHAGSKATISKTAATVPLGGSVRLKVRGVSGRVVWKSSNPKVASVKSNGTVQGRKLGTATISATAGRKKVTCRVKVIYNAKVAAKNIRVTYRKVPNGIVAICKNNNSVAVALDGTMKFLDSAKHAICTAQDNSNCLGAGETCVLFYKLGTTPDGEYPIYNSYRGTLKAAYSEHKSYSRSIYVASDPRTVEFSLSVTNNSGKKLKVIRISCLLYDASGRISGCVQKYVGCYQKGSTILENVPYPPGCGNCDKIRLYVDCAYT